MRLTFRQRLFWGLVGLGTVPLGLALAVLVVQVRSTGSPSGPRAALDEIAETGRRTMDAIDTLSLGPEARAVLREHARTIASRTTMARRAEALSRFTAGALAVVIAVLAVVVLAASLHLARRWSSYASTPIEQLVDWVRRIRRREPLPDTDPASGPDEFAALRAALREMATELETARRQELERERLVAFREAARRVAHEIRSPVTAAQLALAQLDRDEAAGARTVLREEIARLDDMARTFSEFGRLPEGPQTIVNVNELIDNVVSATVPAGMTVHIHASETFETRAQYEPLRRAVQNLVRNAVESTNGQGIEVTIERVGEPDEGRLKIEVADHGPGVPANDTTRIFEPYYTTKTAGTGLGLAMVRQIVLAHGGRVHVGTTPGGGATFTIELPDES